ncbi:MAG TPA: sensor histidine kinase [Pseudonocardiaceae bacterium]|nr:sensor histidine kinase [Pseudonocardiaceae bacterium]
MSARELRISRGDVALAALTGVIGVVGVGTELADRAAALPPVWAYALTVAGAVLLLFRRQAAMPVALGNGVFCVAYHLLGYPGLAVATPLVVAAYTVVVYAQRRRSLVATSVLVAAVIALPLIPPHPDPVNFGAVSGVLIAMGATLAAAEAARSRRIAGIEQLRRVEQETQAETDRRLVVERLAIATELHDVLAHTITVIGVQAAAGLDALDRAPEEARSALHTIRASTRDAMAELRSTVRVLRDGPQSGTVTPQPRLAELPQVIDSATAAGLRITLDTDGDQRTLPAPVELAAYRIVQEALTNVIRHARAESATVRVEYQPDALLVEVADDGSGIVADRAVNSGHGMIGMRERARAVGGTFEATPVTAPGRGFVVRARLPLGGTP